MGLSISKIFQGLFGKKEMRILMPALRHRNWYIQATCATSGDGLYEGLDWLSCNLKKRNSTY
ncbi:hypothetical protein PCK1_001288 [Pneumocystis canis]|nr:hypothetical protein PCK1_001288 [Pneumocystis canis]